MILWEGGEEVKVPWPKGIGWVRMSVRVILIAVTIFGLIPAVLFSRVIGLKSVAEAVVRTVCIICLKIVGIRVIVEGEPMHHTGAVVANHASWLDVFSLNAVQPITFVSKAEVRNWPLIGVIARSAGTAFIERKTSDARRQKDIFLERITRGDKLLFFPEGTSTDGRRVLRFRSSLFAAFFEFDLIEKMWIQPATVNYHAPDGEDARFYGWWGDMDFASHFAMVLAARRQGHIVIRFHPPIRVADVSGRKALAEMCETAVRGGLQL